MFFLSVITGKKSLKSIFLKAVSPLGFKAIIKIRNPVKEREYTGFFY